MRCRFICVGVTSNFNASGEKYSEEVLAWPVYASEGPNKAWAESTPAGEIQLTVTNPGAWGAFKKGRDYYVDFSEIA